MSGQLGYVPITIVNVQQQQGPIPSVLQRTGAIVVQGGTTLTPGTYSLLVAPSSLTPLTPVPLSLTGITQTAGLATAVAAANHGYTIGDTILLTIAGATIPAYNGTFLCTVTTVADFTFAIPSGTATPATGTITYTPADNAETVAAVTTFFSNGSANSVYVLELGAGNAADGQTALAAFIVANPGKFYSYLVPHSWGISATFYSTFALNYTSPTAKTYFHVTTTLAFWEANKALFAATLKCLIVTIEAPAVAAQYVIATYAPTEFSAASGFYVTLNLNPSPANQVTQAAYSYLYGVTPYPVMGNQALFASLEAANISIVGTGQEAGVPSRTIWYYGTTLDGNDFNKYWYSVDNVQINLDLNTSNAVINGSNNPLAPLNYNQQGIKTLQSVAGSTMASEIAFSLALGPLVLTQMTGTAFAAAVAAGQFAGQVVVNAVPFASYVTLSPGDYPTGKYAGLSVAYTVQLGFKQIVYNVVVSNFV